MYCALNGGLLIWIIAQNNHRRQPGRFFPNPVSHPRRAMLDEAEMQHLHKHTFSPITSFQNRWDFWACPGFFWADNPQVRIITFEMAEFGRATPCCPEEGCHPWTEEPAKC